MTTTKPQSTTETLEPCPFCPHGIGFVRNESGRYNGVVWVECDWPSHAVRLTAGSDAAPPCGARTAEYQTEEEAIKAWNTRVPASTAPVVDNDAEKEFFEASVAVWREIDRLSLLPEGYKGLPPDTDPRTRERAAWERYRSKLDTAAATAAPVEQSDGPEEAYCANCRSHHLLPLCDKPEYRSSVAITSSSTSARAAAEEIVKAWLWHTPEHDQDRARVSIIAIIERHYEGAR